ncbi:MAG: aspartyl/glutamyl-tRNA amidotransferase subunit C [Chloroflexi bacterium]|nr:aspartyl/glutamyl-tRNA amidotransferase subunit C [Chloroflexota bacterium]
MTDRDNATAETLRELADRQRLRFSEAELVAGAVQLESILESLGELDQFEITGLEPTTYICFDDPSEVTNARA